MPDTLAFMPDTLVRRINQGLFGEHKNDQNEIIRRRIRSLLTGYAHFQPDTLTFGLFGAQKPLAE